MDFYFQGQACLHKGVSTLMQARDFFERSLVHDQLNVDALVGIALVDLYRAVFLMPDDRLALLASAETGAAKALSLAPDHAFAHWSFGRLQHQTNRAAQCIAECERALALDRNLAGAHASIGIAKVYLGRAEETEAHVNDALRLSPRDTNVYMWLMMAGFAKFYVGREEEAVVLLRRSVEANRNHPLAHFAFAAALAHLGRLDEARAAVQAGLALNPSFTVTRYRAGAPTDNSTFLAQRERSIEGMRMAGLPEE
jgi:tetratricopeptide (TPR) repeat protein